MKRKRKPIASITVGELIEILQDFPQKIKVVGLDDMRDPETLSPYNFRRVTVWEHSTENKPQEVIEISIPRQGWYEYEEYE